MEDTFKDLMGVPIKSDQTKVFYFEDPPQSEIDKKLNDGLDPYLAPNDIKSLFEDDGYSKYNEMTRKFRNDAR
ncbi:MAG: hypothetical protein GY814_19230 [Gammaproteobacteria bacterium]|nr:hypothetical protein [Gammaproteobacteria bacterium]